MDQFPEVGASYREMALKVSDTLEAHIRRLAAAGKIACPSRRWPPICSGA
ncbi:hypothetical protein [Brucella anthropi]